MRKKIKEAAFFVIYRILFPLQYCLYRLRKLDKKKAVFIELNYQELSGSLQFLYQRMKERGDFCLTTHCIDRLAAGELGYIKNVCRCLKDAATARYIFMCEGNRFISCVPIRKETIVTQLWHGCGAFKKFGMSTADLIFGGNRKDYKKYPYYRNLTYVTVSSPEVVWAFEEAMDLKNTDTEILPIGISRTDIFFQGTFQKKAVAHLHQVTGEVKGKKILLYAPTFRGNVEKATAPEELDIALMKKALGDEYILLIKHHPLVKNRPKIGENDRDFAIDVTERMSIDELLYVSDICISDYSSLVFEYSLFERPMIFYAYDLQEYDDWRGFYYDYKEMTPGPVVFTTEEIVDYILHIEERFQKEEVQEFRNKFMSACDGRATERLIELVMKRRL